MHKFESITDLPGIQRLITKGGEKVKIYYRKNRDNLGLDLGMGLDFVKKHHSLPDTEELLKTHYGLLCEIQTQIAVEGLFCSFQGESYSPEGEAAPFIKAQGLFHTSMSVGDIIKYGDTYYFVDSYGMTEM
ncbi:hypothetical protein ACFKA9_002695 [Vibrio parahaemolyticus]